MSTVVAVKSSVVIDVDEPMVTPSIVPPSMSTVENAELLKVTPLIAPVTSKSPPTYNPCDCVLHLGEVASLSHTNETSPPALFTVIPATEFVATPFNALSVNVSVSILRPPSAVRAPPISSVPDISKLVKLILPLTCTSWNVAWLVDVMSLTNALFDVPAEFKSPTNRVAAVITPPPIAPDPVLILSAVSTSNVPSFGVTAPMITPSILPALASISTVPSMSRANVAGIVTLPVVSPVTSPVNGPAKFVDAVITVPVIARAPPGLPPMTI